jgi:1-acyl-sn-glycerol-3-phosphate acyltransferase
MNCSYRLGWIFFRTLFATYFPSRFFNAARVPAEGAVILAANHASFIDPPLVGAGFNRAVNYLGRDTLFNIPVLAFLLRSWRVVPVDRDGGGGAGLKAILRRLREGGMILLFPEGTRTRDGHLQPAKPGVGLIVLRSDAPIVPVRLFGTFEAYGRHRKLPRPGRFIVHYGPPLDFRTLREEARHCSKERLKGIYQEIADEIMAAIAALSPHPEQSPPANAQIPHRSE